MTDEPARLKCTILDTGHGHASEHHLLSGGRRCRVACHATVALFAHPRHGKFVWDTGYAPRVWDLTRRLPYRLYRWVTRLPPRSEPPLVERLALLGVRTADVSRVFISHFHPDHIGGLRDFPQAEFVASRVAIEHFQSCRGLRALSRGHFPQLLPDDFAQRCRLLDDFSGPALGDLGPTHDFFGDRSTLLAYLPGHARGQLGLLAETERGPMFLVSDACWLSASLRENRPPHRITRWIADDYTAALATLAALNRLARDRPDITFCPTHCPETLRRCTPVLSDARTSAGD